MKFVRQRLIPFILAAAAGMALTVLNDNGKLPLFDQIDRSCLLASRILLTGESTLARGVPGSRSHGISSLVEGQFISFGNLQITDDPDEIFHSNPPSPTDISVILAHLKENDHYNVCFAYPLAWDDMDSIAQGLLEAELEGFSKVALGFPATRSSEDSPIPSTVSSSTLSLSQIENGGSSLPRVNRFPITPATYGNDGTLIGFTELESEPQSQGKPHLIARWDDRILLSVSLLAFLLDQDIKLQNLKVDLGSHIDLGPRRGKIPIDEFGRFAGDLSVDPPNPIAAEAFVAPLDGTPHQLFGQTILVSKQGTSPAQTLSQLFTAPSPGPPVAYTRLPPLQENGLLIAFAAHALLRRRRWVLISAPIVAILLWLVLPILLAWIPGSIMIGTTLATILIKFIFSTQSAEKPNDESGTAKTS